MVVDKVSAALEPSQHAEDVSDSSGKEEEAMSDDNDAEMSEEAEEMDDLMTLVQFQVEQRRGTLVRKCLQVPGDSHKKGRVEVGGSSST